MSSPDLSGLIGSRICHDIISPLGAIGNGVELLALSGMAPSEEMTLISDSVGTASARIRLFRLAFGAATPGQDIGRAEVAAILEGLSDGGRLSYRWDLDQSADRAEVRAALLGLLCLENALPQGGDITITRGAAGWHVRGSGRLVATDADLWTPLAEGRAPATLTSGTVQFALLPTALAELGRSVTVETGDGRIALAF